MPMHVVNGAILRCSSDSIPSNLVVLPLHKEQIENQFAANISDHVPAVNICPFGVCAVTEVACVPATPSPWTPGSPTVALDSQPALDDPVDPRVHRRRNDNNRVRGPKVGADSLNRP
jgi:Domain of unknown function (DUF4280)